MNQSLRLMNFLQSGPAFPRKIPITILIEYCTSKSPDRLFGYKKTFPGLAWKRQVSSDYHLLDSLYFVDNDYKFHERSVDDL